LAWLGLSRAGSLLGSAWDGVSEIFEKGTNWLQGEGFVTNKEIAVKAALQEFHRMGIEEAKAAALQEYGIQKGKKILDSFYTDSREKTDAKIWALKQAGYDTTAVEMEVAKRRQAMEERKKEQSIEQSKKTIAKEEVNEASFHFGININNVVKTIKGILGLSNGYYEKIDDNWVHFNKAGEGFNDYCTENQQDHKYVTKEFADIVAEAIETFHNDTGKTIYLNDFSPKEGEKSEFGHHDGNDRGYVVDVKWVSNNNTLYSCDYDKCENYDRDLTIKLIESFIENAKPYIKNGNEYQLRVLFNDKKVIEYFKNEYKSEFPKFGANFKIYEWKGHANHLHIQLYKVK